MTVARWVQVGNDIDGESPNDRSGWSVALSSNGAILAVGATRNDGGGGIDSGHVRVYINTGGGWTRLGGDLDGAAPGDLFGWAVALSGDGMTLAVGARLHNGVEGTDSGEASVYGWNGSVWEARGSSIEGQAGGDEFGVSIALSDDGTVLAVGAPGNDVGGSDAGHVRVFGWNGTDWSQMGNNLEGSSAGDRFGDAITLSSDGLTLACNADRWGTGSGGYVRAYHWSGETWIPRGSTLVGFLSGDQYGVSVSLSGDGMVLAIGASRDSFCEVYGYDGTDWFQIGQSIRFSDGSDLDLFGHAVALSFAGDTVVIGAPFDDSNGTKSGIAQVYRLTSNREQWVRVGQDLVGESSFDQIGVAVSISDTGNRIAVGANFEDGNGSNAGHVRVFNLE